MSLLDDDLKEITNEIAEYELRNSKLHKAEKVFGFVEGFGCVSTIILWIITIVFIVFCLTEINSLIQLDGFFTWLFVIALYASLSFFGGYLNPKIECYFKKVIYGVYNIDEEQFLRHRATVKGLYEKKSKIKNELNNEKENQKQNELKFIQELDELLNGIKTKSLSENGALIRQEALRKKYYFSKNDTDIYYVDHIQEKLKDIEIAVKEYSAEQIASNTRRAENSVLLGALNTLLSKDTLSKSNDTLPKENIKPSSPVYKANEDKKKGKISEKDLEIFSKIFEESRIKNQKFDGRFEKIKPKIDYLKLQELRQNIGFLGEEFALKWETENLMENVDNLHLKLNHVSLNNDSAGYDILSYSNNGEPKYIEVKTTTDGFNCPFYLSENENSAMRRLKNYFIYRVYNFDIESKLGDLLIIDCSIDIDLKFIIQPSGFKVSPNFKPA